MLGAPSGLDAPDLGGASGGIIREVGGSSGGGVEEAERSSGGGGVGGGAGNRWPREETLALLKIRSDMDVAFRDSSLKGPLWEEVSRKMAELGFQRSAKKCKEKFENVYKYHRRTKDGRASKSDGKTYRFFDQLEAFESLPPPSSGHPTPQAQSQPAASSMPASVTVAHPISSSLNFQPLQAAAVATDASASIPPPTHAFHTASMSSDSTPSSSSSTSSDEDIRRRRRRGRKRKWKEFFRNLMRDVLRKQEELQEKFLNTLEKLERDRTAREETWRAQETARMNREHERLAQERSMAATKDAAVMAFLQKVTDQNSFQIPITTAPTPIQPPQNPPPTPQSTLAQTPTPPPIAATPVTALTPIDNREGGGGNNSIGTSSSRWPKSEIQALINLRTSLELKYHDSGPKGPLWEEISAGMARLGYSRSAKRCKEKWENINKYYKKVKESNKKRPVDSKTCPYYYLLDAIYKEKEARSTTENVMLPGFNLGHDNPVAAPIMARPEQQWPPLPQHSSAAAPDQNGATDSEDDDDGGEGYEMVTNKLPSPVERSG